MAKINLASIFNQLSCDRAAAKRPKCGGRQAAAASTARLGYKYQAGENTALHREK